ncbi:MAG: hypothetical protein LBK58_03070 [Prevotellaceae bacterium]|jgi:hypothetical protein|nr:hypothetical protein [Prevotellaceae bacterium]
MEKAKRLFLRLLGYRYVANLRSKEIHRLDTDYKQCNIPLIRAKKYLRKKDLGMWERAGYNGCRFCLPFMDTDIKRDVHVCFT